MGGHGGLNILPQKRWNVYRYDNREKVSRDEAKEAKRRHLQQDTQRRLRLDSNIKALRRSRHCSTALSDATLKEPNDESAEIHPHTISNHQHINLFEQEEHQMKQHEYHTSSQEHKPVDSPSRRFGRNDPAPWYACPPNKLLSPSHKSTESKKKSSSFLHTLRLLQISQTTDNCLSNLPQ